MKKLMGYVIKNGKVLKMAEREYDGRQEFFVAMVNIADALGIEIPIWTLKEDRKLARDNKVLIQLDNECVLKIESKNA